MTPARQADRSASEAAIKHTGVAITGTHLLKYINHSHSSKSNQPYYPFSSVTEARTQEFKNTDDLRTTKKMNANSAHSYQHYSNKQIHTNVNKEND